jgi:hypothetical protein
VIADVFSVDNIVEADDALEILASRRPCGSVSALALGKASGTS